MLITKPKHLRPGDVIGICAPASPPATESDLEKGIRYLERAGFRVEVGKNVHRRRGYLAGSDAQRLSDLHSLFASRHVRAIFTARGGYGSQRLLSLIDYSLVRRNPKIVVGYSDITALHLAFFTRTGLVSFSGPMVAVEMSRGLSGKVEERFWRCLMTTDPPEPLGGTRRIPAPRQGSATGRLIAGNLSMIASLLGTSYFPVLPDPIALIEEVGERPYRLDRMMRQLGQSKPFSRLRGIGAGKFIDCQPEKGKPSLTLQSVLAESLAGLGVPVVDGLPFGHYGESAAIPLGVRVRLDGSKCRLEFLEGGVS